MRHSFADKVFFCNSGAEANEGAFKFARRWARSVGGPVKHEIIALRGSFHGRLFASLAATDRPRYRAPFRPLAGGVTIAERDLGRLADTLVPETTAALVVEPVQGEGGVRVFDPGFLRELRSMTAERRIALVLDEVQCGLGRTGWLFAYERAGIEPDLLALAKPLAGGLPMGAVLLSGEIAAAIETGDHGSTFGGGPFVSTVARYVVGRIADPALLESVREHGEWLSETLNQLAAASPHVRGVRGVGLIWGIDIAMRAAPIIECGAGDGGARALGGRPHAAIAASAHDHARGVGARHRHPLLGTGMTATMTATMTRPGRTTVTRAPAARVAVTYRSARAMDVPAIVALINEYAARGVMLPKSPEVVALALDDFIVAADQTGRLLGCAAIREYSPSIAEVGSVAVVARAHGTGIGGELVRRVEQLAACRGVNHLVALTMTPRFFQSLGYDVVEKARYPEKVARDCNGCARRFDCPEICVARHLN